MHKLSKLPFSRPRLLNQRWLHIQRIPKIRLFKMLEEMLFFVCVCSFMDSWKPVIFRVLLSIIRGLQLHSHKAVVRIQGNNVLESALKMAKCWTNAEWYYHRPWNADGSAIISNPNGNFFFFFRTRSPLSNWECCHSISSNFLLAYVYTSNLWRIYRPEIPLFIMWKFFNFFISMGRKLC